MRWHEGCSGGPTPLAACRRRVSLASRSPSDRFLAPDPRVEEPYRLTPRLALRIGILGALAIVAFLADRQEDFRGVQVVNTYLRSYPHATLAAHVLGYVGEISPSQLKQLRSDGYRPGDLIGQGGVEATYDRYLRGTPGVSQVVVDSLGRPISTFETQTVP